MTSVETRGGVEVLDISSAGSSIPCSFAYLTMLGMTTAESSFASAVGVKATYSLSAKFSGMCPGSMTNASPAS